MQQELIDGFIDPFPLLVTDSHFAQEEHRHEQRVRPELLRVAGNIVAVRIMTGYMFKAAFAGFRQVMNQIIRPLLAQGLPFGQIISAGQFKERQERRGGIDVDRGQTDLQIVLNPLLQEFVILLMPPGFLKLQQTVETHSLRPVPFFDSEIPGEKPLPLFFIRKRIDGFGVRGIQIHQFIDDQIQFFINQLLIHSLILLTAASHSPMILPLCRPAGGMLCSCSAAASHSPMILPLCRPAGGIAGSLCGNHSKPDCIRMPGA